ncbi:hypothetical protein [Nocardia pseudovaccinii]|uniref:hypothetical protein n=1 Tax=Nocardia pseudovaccinii TaxID=189540 RepID=UPI0007A51ED9|nr:hypothetical protein [Nocardia pseudovaccinii]
MRTDLLALTDDSLIALANRGIVKRAVKENAATPPQLTETPDSTIEARFPDGTHTTLPPGVTIEAAPCSCGAPTLCRHRVMTVLAYRDAKTTMPPRCDTAAAESTAADSTAPPPRATNAAEQSRARSAEPVTSAATTIGPGSGNPSTANRGHASTADGRDTRTTLSREPETTSDGVAGDQPARNSDPGPAGRHPHIADTESAESVTADRPTGGPHPDTGSMEGHTSHAGWTPGEFTDDQLNELLGKRAFMAAGRARRAGYRATVRRASAQDPVPSVELAAVTVRFLVPGDLGYARADAARGARLDAIALAVWAFRVADATDPAAESVTVTVGDAADGAAAVSAVQLVVAPLADLLTDGVAHAGSQLPAIFANARRDLDRAGARWPHDVLDDLLDQLTAYRDRSARHDPTRTAALIAELVARQRACSRNWVAVLGTEEPAETPLRHLRLTGLGAWVGGDAETRGVELYLAHAEARIVLTLHHSITVPADAEPPDAAALGARRCGPARIADLAAGNVVTESAIRSANRAVRLANSRVARTSVMPSAGAWETLPPELLIGDLDAESARIAALPPAPIRPRVHGESVRALIVETVEAIRYLPGEQRLVAQLRCPVGTATAIFTHTSATPGAIDALTESLSGALGPVRYVAGILERHAGHLTITPTAVVAGRRVIVPSFAPTGILAPPDGSAAIDDPLAATVTTALAITAEVAHRGIRHLPPSWFDRATDAAGSLRRHGFATAATTLDILRTTLATPISADTALDLWADTHLRLLVTAEQL